jgi:short-subunit dehydrogenase
MTADTKPALIVTGASSGIGRELARVAAPEFAAVLLIARSEDALAALGKEIGGGDVAVDYLVTDLQEADAGERVEAKLALLGWHGEVLINAAGFGLLGNAWTLARAAEMEMVDVNVRALTELTLRLLPGMIARRRGGVINIGSTAGYAPGPGMAIYYASKAYLRSFTDALHHETRGTGVTMTSISPGPVETGFARRAGAGATLLFTVQPRLNARQVAEAGWRGFRSGRRLVVPGSFNWLMATFSGAMPTGVLLRMVARMQKTKTPKDLPAKVPPT